MINLPSEIIQRIACTYNIWQSIRAVCKQFCKIGDYHEFNDCIFFSSPIYPAGCKISDYDYTPMLIERNRISYKKFVEIYHNITENRDDISARIELINPHMTICIYNERFHSRADSSPRNEFTFFIKIGENIDIFEERNHWEKNYDAKISGIECRKCSNNKISVDYSNIKSILPHLHSCIELCTAPTQ